MSKDLLMKIIISLFIVEIKDRGVAQSGRASALGVEGQVFESLFPDQSYQYS